MRLRVRDTSTGRVEHSSAHSRGAVVVVGKALGTNRVPGGSTTLGSGSGRKRDVRNPRGFGESLPKTEIGETTGIAVVVVSDEDTPRDSGVVTPTDAHHVLLHGPRGLRATLISRTAAANRDWFIRSSLLLVHRISDLMNKESIITNQYTT